MLRVGDINIQKLSTKKIIISPYRVEKIWLSSNMYTSWVVVLLPYMYYSCLYLDFWLLLFWVSVILVKSSAIWERNIYFSALCLHSKFCSNLQLNPLCVWDRQPVSLISSFRYPTDCIYWEGRPIILSLCSILELVMARAIPEIKRMFLTFQPKNKDIFNYKLNNIFVFLIFIYYFEIFIKS